MINKIQMKLLPAGFNSNTDIAKRFKTGARAVVMVDPVDKSEAVYTPNRRQRRQMEVSRDQPVLTRGAFGNSNKTSAFDRFRQLIGLPKKRKKKSF